MIMPTRLLVEDEPIIVTPLQSHRHTSDPSFKLNQVMSSSKRPHVITSSPLEITCPFPPWRVLVRVTIIRATVIWIALLGVWLAATTG